MIERVNFTVYIYYRIGEDMKTLEFRDLIDTFYMLEEYERSIDARELFNILREYQAQLLSKI